MFRQKIEYHILPKGELTPALSVEKPYVTIGELEMVENMVHFHQSKDLMDKPRFATNEC